MQDEICTEYANPSPVCVPNSGSVGAQRFAVAPDAEIQEIPPWKAVHEPAGVCGGYRLGDMVSSMYRWDVKWGQEYHFKNFPQSLACMYMRATDEAMQWEVLSSCVDQKFKGQTESMENCLVVHLRVGDVLDTGTARNHPIDRFLSEWVPNSNGGYYVTPLIYYENFTIPNDVLKVVIIANPYFQVDDECEPSNSKIYIDAVARTFRKRGLENVQVRTACGHGNMASGSAQADKDFVLAVSGNALIISGGLYGRALGNVAKSRGVPVFRPPKKWDCQKTFGKELVGDIATECQLEEFCMGDSWEC